MSADVLIAPHSAGNPYQDLIAAELMSRGLEVRGVHSRWHLLRLILARPAALHLHWTHQYVVGRTFVRSLVKSVVFLVTMLLARGLGTRIVWTVHNVTNHRGRSPQVERTVHRLLGRLVHAVVVHDGSSISIARLIVGRRPPVVVAPHGHYLDVYGGRLDRATARQDAGLVTDGAVVLAFGTMRRQKRLDLLVDCLGHLTSTNVRMVLAGPVDDPELENRLAEAAALDARIDFRPGFVDDRDVAALFSAADVFVQPGRGQLTSGSLLLAMGYGTQVVCDDQPELRRTVAAADAVLTTIDRPEELAAAIDRAVARSMREGAGSANESAARARSWSAHVDALAPHLFGSDRRGSVRDERDGVGVRRVSARSAS